MKRRDVLKAALAAPVAGAIAGAAKPASARPARPPRPRQSPAPATPPAADFIVVGSGAGGGTVAARLVEAGYSVLLLEAGGNPTTPDYDVPAFHPRATEADDMRWDFYVHHYSEPGREAADPNYDEAQKGVWYPRAGTLGGCTAHNALIFVYPSNRDWDQLADLAADPSWRADNMRQYFERLENCRYRPLDRAKSKLGVNPSRHGYSGWLSVEKAPANEVFKDRKLQALLKTSLANALKEVGVPTAARLLSLGDPNDWRVVSREDFGTCYTPLTTHDRQRVGTRERLLDVQRRFPGRLTIELNALASSVLFDPVDHTKAIGVEYLKGERLYQAHATPSTAPGATMRAYARREVILAGGVFNTPQLLMLSGIGPEATLERLQIPVRVRLDNVGQRLQDRYEVSVVSRMREDWNMLRGAHLLTSDPQYREWEARRSGAYTSNGVPLSIVARSSVSQPSPDLFCYALLGDFRGYHRHYADEVLKSANYLTWVVLKGHTTNTGGEVTLTSRDPRVRPAVNFKYFDEGSDPHGPDLDAVVKGVQLVRRMTAGLASSLGLEEELPGPGFEDPDALREWVQKHAWGHHASCTCTIGPREHGGVLGGDFKVHGTANLRVVDASVFPRVPGLFIVSAVYMVGEKAADVIVADAKRTRT